MNDLIGAPLLMAEEVSNTEADEEDDDTYNFAILRHSQEAKRESFWKKIKKLFVNIKN